MFVSSKLLDIDRIRFNENKIQINKASRGGLANRQLPSGNNSNTSSSASNATTAVTIAAANSCNNLSKRTLSNSSSDCALEDSEDDVALQSAVAAAAAGLMGNLNQNNITTNNLHHVHNTATMSASNHELNLSNGIHHHHQSSNLISNGHHLNNLISGGSISGIGNGVGGNGGSVIAGTTTAILLNSTTSSTSSANSREQQINQLYAQVHKDHKTSASHTALPGLFKNSLGSPGEATIITTTTTTTNTASPNDFHRGGMTTFGTSCRDLNSSYDSILGSNDKLSENEHSSDNWMYPSRRRVGPTGAIISGKIPPTSFTEQLNQALSERER